MDVYMYMGMFSDDPEPDLAFFEDKKDCLDYLNAEIDRYAEEYGFEREDIDIGMNQWNVVTPQHHEMTFIFRKIDIKEKSNEVSS
jgi:hypothetical protein